MATWMTGHAQQQYTQLTDVPTIYIETENAQPITSKETYIMCTVTYVDGDQVTRYEQTQIRGRGNSSWWNSEKKPYRIKFNKKQELLGPDFAKAKSWPLLANHGDKTMIRNALTYDLGRFMGLKFCPAAKFVDLYLNGEYRGTFQISDQVQVHKKRVDISEQDGWLLEVANNNSKEEPYIQTSVYDGDGWRANILYNIKNPDDENYTDAKRQQILQFMTSFEQAVKSDNFRDPEQGYRAYVDEDDLINWYVAAEITGNIDALYSIYMYKDADEQKLHFGPLWDLDMGYDNSSEKSLLRSMEAYLWLWNRPYEQIIQRMWEDPWFARRCSDRMNQLVDAGLEDYLLHHVDSLRTAIYQSQAENFKRWKINEQVYSFEKHNYHNTYDEYIADLKAFVTTHLAYLKKEFNRRSTALGIKNIHTDQPAATDGPIYDLSGRQVSPRGETGGSFPTRKGVYIRGGRKVVL